MRREQVQVGSRLLPWPVGLGVVLPCILLFAMYLATPAWAQQGEASVFVARGVLAYDEKRYEDALESLREALRLEPDNVDALYYTGLTDIALKRYDQATEALERARKREPRDQSVLFQLGALYFGLEQYDRAQPLLEDVFAANPRLDSLGYYVGFMRYRQKDYQGALRAFKAGASTDPNIQQLTHFYSGLALGILGLPEQATAELKDALKGRAASALTGPAERVLGAVTAAAAGERRLRADVRFGFFYDDNVPVSPDQGTDPLVGQLRHRKQANVGELGSARVDYSFFRQGGWDATATASFFASYNNELTTFNIVDYLGGLGTSYRGTIGGMPYQAALQYTYDYLTLGGPKFIQRHTVVPSLVVLPNSWNLDAFQLRFQDKGYGQETNLPNPEKRDGQNYMAGLTHAFRFSNDQHLIRIGYQWDFEDLDGPHGRGRDYSYYGNRVLVGGQYTLPWRGIRLTNDFDVHIREYLHVNQFFPSQAPNTVRRKDTEYTNVFAVVVPLPYNLTFTVSYQHIFDQSNLAVFHYHRNVVSAILGWTY
jgi:tetratricopeptide (TPR) repeat protein